MRQHAELIARDQQERELEPPGEVGAVVAGVERGEQAAGALDEQDLGTSSERAHLHDDRIEVDSWRLAFELSRVGGDCRTGTVEASCVGEGWIAGCQSEGTRVFGEWINPGFDGLEGDDAPAAGSQRGGERAGYDRLARAGTWTGDQ